MSTLLWGIFSNEWQLYYKVTFDGVEKTITINPGETIISVKDDIYSAWKEWVMTYDYSKYFPALRTIGGDPVGGGQYAGDMYFLINNWRVIIPHAVTINGILYSDNYPSPYVINAGGGVVNKVSSLAYAYSTTGSTAPSVAEIRTEMDNNSSKLLAINTKVQTLTNGPTAAAIADEVRVELTAELAHIMTLQNGQGLSSPQAVMLLEMYNLLGLDPTKPLVVTNTSRSVTGITQQITSDANSTTVQRV